MSEPSTSIFCRTYSGDAEWLKWLVRSIKRHVSGFEDIIFACDKEDVPVIAPIVADTGRIVVSPKRWSQNGWIQQQIHKVVADWYVKTPHCLYVDSDMAFIDAATPSSFMVNNKPHVLYTPYDTPGFEATVPWRPTVEKIMKEPVFAEWMRGPRLGVVVEMLPSLRAYLSQIHGRGDVLQFLAGFPQLSEFNLMYAYAWKFCQDRYVFSNTCTEALPKNPLRQWWSKGGVTEDIRLQLEAALA